MKLKKSALIGIMAVALVALLAVGTWAWFTAEADAVENKFTAGTVEIELKDMTLVDGEEAAFPTDGISNWNPGDETDKIVYVVNTGTKCAYVRVKLIPEWKKGDQTISGVSNVTYEIGQDWLEGAEGWYYYKSKLMPGTDAKTSNLIEKVCLKGAETGNEYQGATFTLEVEAEAVQCSNGAPKDLWKVIIEDDIITGFEDEV